jgi:hypothetical protein
MNAQWDGVRERWSADDIFDAVRGTLADAEENRNDPRDNPSWPFGNDDNGGGKRCRVQPKPKILT